MWRRNQASGGCRTMKGDENDGCDLGMCFSMRMPAGRTSSEADKKNIKASFPYRAAPPVAETHLMVDCSGAV